MKKIVILSNSGESYDIEKNTLLDVKQTKVVIAPFSDEKSIIKAVKEAYVVGCSDARITATVIDSLSTCKMIIRYGVGVDSIDLEAAKRKGIMVCNTPSYGTIDVAEHTIALLLALSRQITHYDNRLRHGPWAVDFPSPPSRLAGKTIGLVGFGRISQHVALIAQGLAMEVIAYDPFLSSEVFEKRNVVQSDLENLFKKADIISLHLPLTEESENLVGSHLLSLMKKSAFFINTGRGGLVDLDALTEALQRGEIGGVGLDVFPEEPLSFDHPLRQCKGAVLTPHIAWFSKESIIALHQEAADEMRRVVLHQKPLNRVV